VLAINRATFWPLQHVLIRPIGSARAGLRGAWVRPAGPAGAGQRVLGLDTRYRVARRGGDGHRLFAAAGCASARGHVRSEYTVPDALGRQ